jgi:hypothetical protein
VVRPVDEVAALAGAAGRCAAFMGVVRVPAFDARTGATGAVRAGAAGTARTGGITTASIGMVRVPICGALAAPARAAPVAGSGVAGRAPPVAGFGAGARCAGSGAMATTGTTTGIADLQFRQGTLPLRLASARATSSPIVTIVEQTLHRICIAVRDPLSRRLPLALPAQRQPRFAER